MPYLTVSYNKASIDRPVTLLVLQYTRSPDPLHILGPWSVLALTLCTSAAALTSYSLNNLVVLNF